MADDDCNCARGAESMAEKLHGETASAEQIAEKFALYGLKKRAAALDGLASELRDEISSGSHNLRRRAQLMALRRKLSGVHDALRKAGR